MGPMTGRAAGYCAGYSVPGYMNAIPGRGYGGWGRGGGRGRRNWFYATGMPGWARAASGYPAFGGAVGYGAPYAAPYGAPYRPAAYPAYGAAYAAPFAPAPTKEQEMEGLKSEAEYLEDALDGIKKRIEELEAEA